ncbi:hypothetical protein EMIHUDRAFT_455554 [Emiliania huxleyi CCMP1516]|uniref:S1 motif domain-containing protein n=2 Tax=Emiliania huxleyi TaxID=2903 RepID=A0A0D3KFY3_EMIH1|nr:hypothetical protein EMIHUDRAFT_455554 [Emiliania huxleyi CCMP1516]EOD34668.1 hypothetical protein EMIHUDRAFT_455554 [Emiliania huxleyi CCMP1516]|eukprot:XP_005787097.1 hypothetical protein EMIHUDRAFT_455554 [Emiliania huxleyi CCMP1516]
MLAPAAAPPGRPRAAADPPSERAPVARDAGILSAAAVRALASDLDALPTHVEGCVRLLAEGHTVPFIARYRQPETGGMAPPLLRRIDAASRDAASLAARCDAVVAALRKTDRLTAQLEAALRAAPTLAALEDAMWCATIDDSGLSQALRAAAAGSGARSSEGGTEAALREGTQKVLAEMTARSPAVREAARGALRRCALVKCTAVAGKRSISGSGGAGAASSKKASTATAAAAASGGENFRDYADFERPLSAVSSHAWLAMHRGVELKLLRLSVAPRDEASVAAAVQRRALEAARCEAIECFAANLSPLLLAPPLRGTAVLGVDPGFAHGHKLAAVRVIAELCDSHGVGAVAVGDGQNSREAQRLVAAAIAATRRGGGRLRYAVVRENGASIYSASDLAAAELGDVPLQHRAAVSIARRLADPLSEFVKIEPAALGVGMYQRDLPAKELGARLDAAVEDAVAAVGVEVNGASPSLLQRVAGLNRKTASALRAHIDTAGELSSRESLRQVPGIGPKTYVNIAGFLRITASDGAPLAEPLDASRARALLAAAGIGSGALGQLARRGGGFAEGDCARLRALAAAPAPGGGAASPGGGRAALVELLCDPLLCGDPREQLAPPPQLVASAPRSLADVRAGDVFEHAVVKNAAPFGLFVDVGVGSDGLLHASELKKRGSGRHVPTVGASICVTAKAVDINRGRLSLALHPVWPLSIASESPSFMLI